MRQFFSAPLRELRHSAFAEGIHLYILVDAPAPVILLNEGHGRDSRLDGPSILSQHPPAVERLFYLIQGLAQATSFRRLFTINSLPRPRRGSLRPRLDHLLDSIDVCRGRGRAPSVRPARTARRCCREVRPENSHSGLVLLFPRNVKP